MVQEKFIKGKAGLPILILLIIVLALSIAAFALGLYFEMYWLIPPAVIAFFLFFVFIAGLKSLRANEARVLTLFGDYYGTLKGPGFFYVHPFSLSYNPAAGTKFRSRDVSSGKGKDEEVNIEVVSKIISLKLMTLDNNLQKVNDLLGNPIEVRISVIWRVIDTAKAVYNVDNYLEYLSIQSDSALRDVVRKYPYDVAPGIDTDGDGEPDEGSLRGSSTEVASRIKSLIQERVEEAGIEIVDARITHLNYAPEIARVMLQRQQAGAVVDARRTIVDGAVGMTEMALQYLESQGNIQFTESEKARLATNLLVVLSGNRDIQPTVSMSAPDYPGEA